MIGPLGRLGAAATLGQHCPQITERPGPAALIRTYMPNISKRKIFAVLLDGSNCRTRHSTYLWNFVNAGECVEAPRPLRLDEDADAGHEGGVEDHGTDLVLRGQVHRRNGPDALKQRKALENYILHRLQIMISIISI